MAENEKGFPTKGTKSLEFADVKSDSSSPRVKTGIAAVTGNVDEGRDRIHAGAFEKTLKDQASRIRHLWGHWSSEPPTATIKEISEIGVEEMPDIVLSKYPDGVITGGLKVTREYLKVPKADWVLAGIDSGAINEMSFAYEVVKATYTEEDGRTVRELQELKLFETSDVNWGMNSATVAAGVKSLFEAKDLPVGYHYAQLQDLFLALKEGRPVTAAEAVLLKELVQQFKDLEIPGVEGLEPAAKEDDQADPTNTKDDDAAKVEAEAARKESTSLLHQMAMREADLIDL